MEYTLGLALMDFVPISAFLVASVFLVKTIQIGRGRTAGRIMMLGTSLVFAGGFLKATWKLLFTLGVGDFQWMSQSQFILLAPGFVAMLVALILLVRKSNAKAPVAAIAAWKIPLLAIMTLSSLAVHGILTYISFQKQARVAAVLFIVAVVCMLGMSGMASGSEQTVSAQWIEQSINSIGQISCAVGSYLLFGVFEKESRPAAAG